MSKKKVFALRMDEEDYKAIERWAADEFRSTNGQLEFIISQALVKSGRKSKSEKISDEKSSEKI